jgi:hypothetical protein
MERFVGIAAAGLAACAVALAVPAAPLGNHLPGCGPRDDSPSAGSAGPPLGLRLRVATIPRIPRGTGPIRWVITVANRTSRARALAFANHAYAEIQLWRGGRLMYSWYRGRLWFQEPWGRVIGARSSWSCIQSETRALALPPGRYTLVAYLRTGGQVPRVRREIAVS